MTAYTRRTRPGPRYSSWKDLRALVAAEPVLDPDPDIAEHDERPQRRSECRGEPRPCPWITCRYHLALDIDPTNGTIKVNHPDRDPLDIPETCSLDVAERGALDNRGIGTLLNVSRARVDQIIELAARRIARSAWARRELGER